MIVTMGRHHGLHIAHFAIMIVQRLHVWGPFNGTGTMSPGTEYLSDAGSSCTWAGTGYASVPTDSEPLGLAVGATGGMREVLCLASAVQSNWTDSIDSEGISCTDCCCLLICMLFLSLLSLRLRRPIVDVRQAREISTVYRNSNAHLKLTHPRTFVRLIDPVASQPTRQW